jgi:hypothetical protein
VLVVSPKLRDKIAAIAANRNDLTNSLSSVEALHGRELIDGLADIRRFRRAEGDYKTSR